MSPAKFVLMGMQFSNSACVANVFSRFVRLRDTAMKVVCGNFHRRFLMFCSVGV